MNIKKINDIIYYHFGNADKELIRKVRNVVTDYHFFTFEPQKENQSEINKKINPDTILDAIHKVLDVDRELIKTKSRKARIVLARQLFCYLIRYHCSYGVVEAGMFINRDHSTVVHSVKSIANLLHINDKKCLFYLNEVLKNI